MIKQYALGLALALIAGTAGAAESHCGEGETVWFSAAVEGSSKLVSICGSASLEAEGAWLEYRFGRPGEIELRFPAESAGSLSAFTIRRYTRPRTTYLKLEFDNGGYNYAILEGHQADEDPQSTASLRVRRQSDGKDVADLDLVMSTEPLIMMRLENRVRTEPFDE
jgi:hypothetical protein